MIILFLFIRKNLKKIKMNWKNRGYYLQLSMEEEFPGLLI